MNESIKTYEKKILAKGTKKWRNWLENKHDNTSFSHY